MNMPADRPLATVVIPTYNDADLLLGALARMKAQTWPNIEIIVGDDGSAEPAEPRVRAWPGYDARISVVRRAVNGGVPAALQAALERARGEYIYFSSTNDPVEPQFLATSIAALERHPRAGMCFSDCGLVSDWSDERETLPLYLAREETWLEPDQLAHRLRQRPFHISSNTVVFRARSIRDTGGCRPELQLYADWYTCMVTALREGAVYIPQVMAYFRTHGGAYSGSARWRGGARAKYAAAAIAAIAAEAPQILPRLRHSAALSDFGLPVLLALARDPQCRLIIGLDTLWVALLRTGWRRMLPRSSRRVLRRIITPHAQDSKPASPRAAEPR